LQRFAFGVVRNRLGHVFMSQVCMQITEGNEPADFKQHFPDWQDSFTQPSSAAYNERVAALKTGGAPVDATPAPVVDALDDGMPTAGSAAPGATEDDGMPTAGAATPAAAKPGAGLENGFASDAPAAGSVTPDASAGDEQVPVEAEQTAPPQDASLNDVAATPASGGASADSPAGKVASPEAAPSDTPAGATDSEVADSTAPATETTQDSRQPTPVSEGVGCDLSELSASVPRMHRSHVCKTTFIGSHLRFDSNANVSCRAPSAAEPAFPRKLDVRAGSRTRARTRKRALRYQRWKP
jgi:hypothetical protein